MDWINVKPEEEAYGRQREPLTPPLSQEADDKASTTANGLLLDSHGVGFGPKHKTSAVPNSKSNKHPHGQPELKPVEDSTKTAVHTQMQTDTPPSAHSTATVSEEGADRQAAVAILLRRNVNPEAESNESSSMGTPEVVSMEAAHGDRMSQLTGSSSYEHLQSLSDGAGESKKTYVIASDDAELREILTRSLEREHEKRHPLRKRQKLRDMVFTRQFSTFDRQNESAANSPFHGFYVLFWISISLLIVKMGADNWRHTGSIFGSNEIMQTMFRRDVVVMLAADGAMCGVTGVSWILQKLVFAGYVNWDRSGWIIQNIWQTAFIGGVVGITLIRDWPWTHTVYFVLHGIVMLMKQHSYAFYNGYLSSAYKKRQSLLGKLKKLETISPAPSPSQTEPPLSDLKTSHLLQPPSAEQFKERRRSESKSNLSDDITLISDAIDSQKPLDMDQLQLFERMIKWEIDALAEEIKGTATVPAHYYPNNLTLVNHYEYICLPTVVYELEYPRSDKINWLYVAEKMAATFGLIFVMIMVSQAFIYPVVMRTVKMKEDGLTTFERFQEFPWLLSDLLFPFMMEYLLAWYLIWEAVLNTLAELTYFADRSFYDAWWNSVSWDQFARDWNRPVHNFLLRHVYNSSISSMHVDRYTATLITFFLSACVHELVMWCLFKKLRGYLLILQMFQLPLVRLSRTRFMKNQKTLGNMMFWLGIFTGPSLLCSLYLIL